ADLGHVDASAVQIRALPLLGGKQLVASGIVDNSGKPLAFVIDGQRNAKYRVSMRKVGGAVQRIDIPAIVAARFHSPALFRHDVVMRPEGPNPAQDKLF